MMDVLLNIALQFWSHTFPIPITLWWKCGIMWTDMVGIFFRRNSHDVNNICGGPPAVPTNICVADIFTLAQGSLGVK